MNKVIVASGPVVVKNNQVLLNISGDDDFWKFCGGKILDDSNLIETAQKRVMEEMGINVTVINNTPYIMYSPKPGEIEKDVLLVHFLAETSDEVKPGAMVKEWAWHDIDKLPANLAPNIIPTLKHFGYIK